MNPDASREINGTYGTIWVDGELWAEVESFEAKLNISYEDSNFANSLATYRKALGWTGDGTMTIKKVYSRVQRKVAAEVKRGRFPRSTIVGKLADPDAYGTERVVLNDVTFAEVLLMKFEQKTKGKEEIPFAFSDYDMPDLIPG
jgi:hypothetical protein